MFPPMVALLRRAIAPIREAASFSSGWVTGEVWISQEVDSAPISTVPSGSSRIPFSSGRPEIMRMGFRKPGTMPVPRLLATIKSEPPARGCAPVSLRICSASARVCGI